MIDVWSLVYIVLVVVVSFGQVYSLRKMFLVDKNLDKERRLRARI